jgi:uncharacterized protein YcfJ
MGVHGSDFLEAGAANLEKEVEVVSENGAKIIAGSAQKEDIRMDTAAPVGNSVPVDAEFEAQKQAADRVLQHQFTCTTWYKACLGAVAGVVGGGLVCYQYAYEHPRVTATIAGAAAAAIAVTRRYVAHADEAVRDMFDKHPDPFYAASREYASRDVEWWMNLVGVFVRSALKDQKHKVQSDPHFGDTKGMYDARLSLKYQRKVLEEEAEKARQARKAAFDSPAYETAVLTSDITPDEVPPYPAETPAMPPPVSDETFSRIGTQGARVLEEPTHMPPPYMQPQMVPVRMPWLVR